MSNCNTASLNKLTENNEETRAEANVTSEHEKKDEDVKLMGDTIIEDDKKNTTDKGTAKDSPTSSKNRFLSRLSKIRNACRTALKCTKQAAIAANKWVVKHFIKSGKWIFGAQFQFLLFAYLTTLLVLSICIVGITGRSH